LNSHHQIFIVSVASPLRYERLHKHFK
jgi:hypothetical protein